MIFFIYDFLKNDFVFVMISHHKQASFQFTLLGEIFAGRNFRGSVFSRIFLFHGDLFLPMRTYLIFHGDLISRIFQILSIKMHIFGQK